MDGWIQLGGGIVLFAGIHFLGTLPVRDRVAAAIGEQPWKGLFSLIALAGVALMVLGYRQSPYGPVLYWPRGWTAWIPLVLMPFAFIGFFGTYMSKDLKRITRHPQLWGVALWAAAHLAANGTAADLALFGGLLIFAFAMMPLSDAHAARGDPQAWAETKRRTSVLPFAALAAGRAAEPRGDLALRAIAFGVLAYLVALLIHARALGVPVTPAFTG